MASIFIYPPIVATLDTGTLASQAKQDVMISELQDVNTELQAVNTELDSQTTELQGINTELDNVTSELVNKLAGSLVPDAFDYIAITYVAAGNGVGEVETATYKSGGSGGTTVATLTLAYDANNKLSSVTKA